MLLCVAVCVLQCVDFGTARSSIAYKTAFRTVSAVCCCALQCHSVLQCVAVCADVALSRIRLRNMQCVAVRCSVLQCVTLCCSVLQCVLQCVAVCVAVCAAVCCSVLQCVAVCVTECVAAPYGMRTQFYTREKNWIHTSIREGKKKDITQIPLL